MTLRCAVVASHPIQYQAPWFREIARRPEIDLRVFFLAEGGVRPQFDPGFQRSISWDVELLDGYEHECVPNVSGDPGTHHFMGLQNPELGQRLDRFRPDAVVLMCCHYWSTYRLILDVRRSHPRLFRGDSHRLARRNRIRETVHRAWLTRIYARMAACLYVGAANHAYFRYHGVGDDRLFFVPHAVDEDRFRRSPQVAEAGRAWRHRMGVPEDHRLVLFVGKLQEKKRPADLAKAFRAADVDRSKLVFVGSGSEEGRLANQAASDPRIRLAGFHNQAEMPSIYAAADLLVLPSRAFDETWGMSVQEAARMGTPSVVSDEVGCAADLVIPGVSGDVFRAGDIEDLARCLRAALASPERLAAWGTNAAKIADDYSSGVATEGLLEALGSVAGWTPWTRNPSIA